MNGLANCVRCNWRRAATSLPTRSTSKARPNRLFGQLGDENGLRSLPPVIFSARLAYYFAETNALHPFREGNGRTQKLLFNEIARRAGYGIGWQGIDADQLLQATIAAFKWQRYSGLESLFSAVVDARSIDPVGRVIGVGPRHSITR